MVAPLATFEGWEKELQEEGVSFQHVQGPRTERHELLASPKTFNLVGYEMLRVSPEMWGLDWDCIILDESATIRKPSSKISHLLTSKFRHVPFRAILSGLPNPSSELDFFQQFKFLFDQFLGCSNWYQFRRKHYIQDGFGWWPRPRTKKLIRQHVRENSFCLTRQEAGLGERWIFETRTVRLPARVLKEYCSALNRFALEESQTKWQVVLRGWLQRLAGGFYPSGAPAHQAKLKELLYLLEGELRREQVVVWFSFSKELLAAKAALAKAGIPARIIKGSTSLQKRKKAAELFRAGRIRVLLCQVRCARFGLDFSAADTAIYFSNTTDPEHRAQSRDRIVSVQKKNPLLLIDLVAKDTHEEDLVPLLKAKPMASAYFTQKLRQAIVKRSKV